jgi:hypothetical protein
LAIYFFPPAPGRGNAAFLLFGNGLKIPLFFGVEDESGVNGRKCGVSGGRGKINGGEKN